MDRIPTENEIRTRIGRFQQLLSEHGVDGALMVQKMDVYYFAGTDQDAHLWISASAEPLLMVRKSFERASQDSPLKLILPLNSLSQVSQYIKENGNGEPKSLGLEMDILPVKMYQAYESLFPHAELVDISSLIRQTRMIKSDYEISQIRAAARITDRMYEQVPRFIEESETEIDLAVKVEGFYRTRGHTGMTRFRTFDLGINYGHIISGVSASEPSASPGPTGGSGLGPFYSQGAGFNLLGRNAPIVIDYASVVNGYISDSARVFSVGKLHNRFMRAHQVMLQVQDSVAQEGRSGVRAKDLYEVALGIVKEAGLPDGFMGYPQPVTFVGHGTGLEMDEWPVIGRGVDTVLETGMVLSLEPKYVFPGEGVVGIENTFLVTEHSMEKINTFPDEIVIC
ncbi:MAG: Xaa-Pro peptidase family protein [Desulfobacteraceae bacterium]|jgi:Xaa-Pro aminopeptidase